MTEQAQPYGKSPATPPSLEDVDKDIAAAKARKAFLAGLVKLKEKFDDADATVEPGILGGIPDDADIEQEMKDVVRRIAYLTGLRRLVVKAGKTE